MIAQGPRRNSVACLALALTVGAGLSACAGSANKYPDFSIPTSTDGQGRVSMQFPGISTPEPTDVDSAIEPLPAGLTDQITVISARASKAAGAFSQNAAPALALAKAAAGKDITSDISGEAQIAFADLTTHHSEGQIALADLDRLAASAITLQAEADSRAAILDAQSRIAATLAEQNKTLLAITSYLER